MWISSRQRNITFLYLLILLYKKHLGKQIKTIEDDEEKQTSKQKTIEDRVTNQLTILEK